MAEEEKLEEATELPENWLHAIRQILLTELNNSVDFHEPQLRQSFKHNYVLFAMVYAALVATGTLLNGALIYHVFSRRLHVDPTYCFMVNLALSNLLMALVVLPLSLTVMIVENWVFGQFLCFFTPMIQVSLVISIYT